MVVTASQNLIFIVVCLGATLCWWLVAQRIAIYPVNNASNREVLDADVARQRTEQWSDDLSNKQHSHANSQSRRSVYDETQLHVSTAEDQDCSGTQLDHSSLDFSWTTETGVSFSDVGGMEEIKQELRVEILKPIRNKKEQMNLELPPPMSCCTVSQGPERPTLPNH